MGRTVLRALLFSSAATAFAPNLAAAAESASYLKGAFVPCKQKGFAKVGGGKCLRKETYEAYQEMRKAAANDGVAFFIQSAARNFSYQKGIWERKWRNRSHINDERERALDILKQSSMPGTSRHHWGTDVDLGHKNCGGDCLNNSAWSSGKGGKAYEWLKENAAKFGFCQPFNGTPSSRNGKKFEHGYLEERWHWTFKPLSSGFLKDYVSQLDALSPAKGPFKGAKGPFKGWEVGAALYSDFVQNVNPTCK